MKNSKEPLVTIVIPTYNRKLKLKHAINSILNQTYKRWELIIIDNNSHDGTDELISNLKNPQIKLITINNNGIIAKSRNKGIKSSKGKYIAFLDSDDWWVPEKLQSCVELINSSNRSVDLIYHSLYVSKSRSQSWSLRKIFARQLKTPIFDDLIKNGNPIATSSVLLSSEIIEDVGYFSEDKNLIAAEDYDYWLRISKVTNNFFAISKPLGHWFHGENTSSPELSLNYLKTLEEKYLITDVNNNLTKKPIWWLYQKGRSLYLKKDWSNSKIYLKQVFLSSSSVMLKLKSIFMLTKMFLIDKYEYN